MFAEKILSILKYHGSKISIVFISSISNRYDTNIFILNDDILSNTWQMSRNGVVIISFKCFSWFFYYHIFRTRTAYRLGTKFLLIFACLSLFVEAKSTFRCHVNTYQISKLRYYKTLHKTSFPCQGIKP